MMRTVGDSGIFAGMLIPIKVRSRWRSMLSGDKESNNEEVLKVKL